MPGNRLLVCVSASATSEDLVRRGNEIARTFGVDWIALHVQTASTDTSSEANRSRAEGHLRLAEHLGADVEVIDGGDVASSIVDFAVRNRISRIVVGKRVGRGLRRILRRSVAAELLKKSGSIDVIVIQGASRPEKRFPSRRHVRDVLMISLIPLGVVAVATAVCGLFARGSVAIANIVMIYLLAVFSVSVLAGWATGLATSLLAVLAFNFFFTRPYHTLNVSDPQYLVTFAVMIVVTLVSSSLAARVKVQAQLSTSRERRTRTLYELSKKLSEASGELRVCEVAQEELTTMLDCEVSVATPVKIDGLGDSATRQTARWCITNGRPAGDGTDNQSETKSLFLPLQGRETVVGVIVLASGLAARRTLEEDLSLFAGMTSLIALALEREQASVSARERLVEIENEKMRNAVLRGISHDLRTPLAVISGSASTLLRGTLDEESTRNLLNEIAQESGWMSRVVENMLHATRLEAGGLQIDPHVEAVDDLITSAVARVNQLASAGYPQSAEAVIRVALPDELLVAPMDLALMEQVIINLLDNAIRYSPRGNTVTVSARLVEEQVEILVEDEGPGMSDGDRTHIFEKFFRGEASRATRGAGLGLWISAAIVAAHHGTIEANNRKEGGACLRVALPGGFVP